MGIMWSTILVYSLAISLASLILGILFIIYLNFTYDKDNIDDEEYLSDEITYDITSITDYGDVES